MVEIAPPSPPVPARTGRRIIQSFEARALKKRPFSVKVADYLTTYFGTLEFLSLNLAFFIAWILLNSGLIPGVVPFDPFPFIFLTMLVSLEAIFLTVVVLISQNRQSYINSLRDELDMQVNLLTERELTKALQLLLSLHNYHQIKREADPELEAMLKKTDISYIERKLEEQLRTEQPTLPKIVAKPITKLATSVKTFKSSNGRPTNNK